MSTHEKPPSRDYRQEITDQVVKMLEEGTAPWQKPWTGGGGLPMNPTTGKPYRGGNILSLMIAGMASGYSDPRWMTFNQAKEAGWTVRKGEHSVARVEYFEPKPMKGETDEEGNPRFYPMHKTFAVFNAQQIDGIPPIVTEPKKPFEVMEAGEKILADSGADIRYGGNQAYYDCKGDHVQLPSRESFVDSPSFYATAAHELVHRSGHPSRLNRPTLTESYKFGDPTYAQEELVAELASLYITAETGIPHNVEQHTAYVSTWIKALKNDKNEIFRAASAASKAADYVLNIDRTVELPVEEGHHAARISAARTDETRAIG
jgi:antirestriction protein ArdC